MDFNKHKEDEEGKEKSFYEDENHNRLFIALDIFLLLFFITIIIIGIIKGIESIGIIGGK